MIKYKTMKVFDCQDMPEEIKEAFFKCNGFASNDCYVKWNYIDYDPGEDLTPIDEFDMILEKIKVDNWLHDNGLGDSPESVLIEHWW